MVAEQNNNKYRKIKTMARGKKVSKKTTKKVDKEGGLTFTFRIADGLGEQLKKRADDEHSSASALMNRFLEEGLKLNLKDRLAELEKRLLKLESAPRNVALYLGDNETSVMAKFELAAAVQAEQRKEAEDAPPAKAAKAKKAVASASSPKKRGRPRKNLVVEVVDFSEDDDSRIEDIEDLATAQSVSHRETYETDGTDDDLRATDV